MGIKERSPIQRKKVNVASRQRMVTTREALRVKMDRFRFFSIRKLKVLLPRGETCPVKRKKRRRLARCNDIDRSFILF